ncbi:AMP-binding protein, partial [Candidatus Woesearchaeota archaeon]|nr:AMP-binding protein [Candidatus Woesearchaeota archaeon]
MGIAELFKQTALRLPDKVAIEFEEQRVTFKELQTNANKVANALNSIGIVKGDRVAHYVPNCMRLIYSLMGNFRNGSIIVPMNISFKEQEIHHILGDSGAKAIITDMERLPIVKNVLKELPELKHIILVDGGEESTLNFDKIVNGAPDKEPETVIKDEDHSIIFYTSGTTGKPKGAALNQTNVTSNVKALAQAWKWSEDDVFLLTLPLYHIHGIGVALCGSLYVGNFTILKKKFVAEDVLETIAKRKV